MLFLLLSLALLGGGGIAAFLAGRKPIACTLGAYSTVAGCLVALYPTLLVLFNPKTVLTYSTTAFALPIGRFILVLDSLSALFLLPTLIIAALCACYGLSSLNRLHPNKYLGGHWFFYNFLVIGLILTFTAADAFLFMISWEIMSLTPFFLITLHDEHLHVRLGAWAYLIGAHIGALFLLGFFIFLSAKNHGALDFATFLENAKHISGTGTLFLLALIGFGTKAGLMPVHVWVPEAYPTAPTHIAGIMSGALSTSGIYGIMRALEFLGTSAPWWAYTLICVGAISAILGVLFAISQKTIKRTLAYSSVENMGIVCMVLGIALFAIQNDKPNLAIFCSLGAMVHLFNHSLYKSLLFLAAGSLENTTGTDILNKLGGLQKHIPVLSFCFFIGATAICALPPLNGFAGEFIMYVGLAFGGTITSSATGFIYWAGLFVLAFASGFSLLCFARVYAIAFLGNPRSSLPTQAQEPPKLEKYTLITLVGLCITSAIASPFIAERFMEALHPYHAVLQNNSFSSTLHALSVLAASLQSSMQQTLNDIFVILRYVVYGFGGFMLVALLLFVWRKNLLKGREVTISPTWDCGYSSPTSKIQYTSGSFAQPAMYFTRLLLRPKAIFIHLTTYFPTTGKAVLESSDWIVTSLYTRIFKVVARIAHTAKYLQHGRVNTYILYILITLVALLAWKIR